MIYFYLRVLFRSNWHGCAQAVSFKALFDQSNCNTHTINSAIGFRSYSSLKPHSSSKENPRIWPLLWRVNLCCCFKWRHKSLPHNSALPLTWRHFLGFFVGDFIQSLNFRLWRRTKSFHLLWQFDFWFDGTINNEQKIYCLNQNNYELKRWWWISLFEECPSCLVNSV